jgi:hypothetical protein
VWLFRPASVVDGTFAQNGSAVGFQPLTRSEVDLPGQPAPFAGPGAAVFTNDTFPVPNMWWDPSFADSPINPTAALLPTPPDVDPIEPPPV